MKLKIDVEAMEHNTQDRTPVLIVESGGSRNIGQHGASVNAEALQAHGGTPPTTEEILRTFAARIMQKIPPNNWAENYEVLTFLRDIRATITGIDTGSLLITVKCDSLQTLERLWKDYLSGHLGEVIQRSFVTEEILTEFSLDELKLKTTISEEEYKACKAYFEKDLSEG